MSAAQQHGNAEATPIVPASFSSLKWEREIRDLRDVNPMLKFVAYTLKPYAGRDGGNIRPSLDELKVQTGLSHAQVKRLRGELVRLGFLELVERGRGRGIKHTSVYRLALPAVKNGSPKDARKRLIGAGENGSSDELPSETQVKTSPALAGEEIELERTLASSTLEVLRAEHIALEDSSIEPEAREDSSLAFARFARSGSDFIAPNDVEAAPSAYGAAGGMGPLPWSSSTCDTFGGRADGFKLTFWLPKAPLRMRLQAFAELHELIGSWA